MARIVIIPRTIIERPQYSSYVGSVCLDDLLEIIPDAVEIDLPQIGDRVKVRGAPDLDTYYFHGMSKVHPHHAVIQNTQSGLVSQTDVSGIRIYAEVPK